MIEVRVRFYHFTRLAAVDSIRQSGILKGIVPFYQKNPPPMVSLTSVLNPAKHGLITGQLLIEGDDPEFEEMSKRLPSFVTGVAPKRTVQLFDQTEVVIEIDIDPEDPNLIDFDCFIDIVRPLFPAGTPKNLLKATAIVTGRYPLGSEYKENRKIDQEVLKLQYSGAIKDPDWYFYKHAIAPGMISSVRKRDRNGEYTIQI
ncbi:hypothetical protein [Pseudomonas sp. BGI-2]|uniref:hypothetical protein n=1 Tax=Pseudomonas sp. BGI-2 TaxID=2528211 RepID=UPI001034F842|nr:hypothetical protein [Pseudomonas sp. BGI-2]TBN31558.1 hypothetical protein EYC95_29760 [Pseudomonas sp. BGI-2]